MARKKKLTRAQKIAQGLTPPVHRCMFCDEEFDSKQQVKRHAQAVHYVH